MQAPRGNIVHAVVHREPLLAEVRQLIAKHGWAVRHVGAALGEGHTVFSYTVGLTDMGAPEVVITGLPFEHAQTFLNNIGDGVRAGERFPPGLRTEDLTAPGAPVTFLTVENTAGLTAVEQIYGAINATQMV